MIPLREFGVFDARRTFSTSAVVMTLTYRSASGCVLVARIAGVRGRGVRRR